MPKAEKKTHEGVLGGEIKVGKMRVYHLFDVVFLASTPLDESEATLSVREAWNRMEPSKRKSAFVIRDDKHSKLQWKDLPKSARESILKGVLHETFEDVVPPYHIKRVVS